MPIQAPSIPRSDARSKRNDRRAPLPGAAVFFDRLSRTRLPSMGLSFGDKHKEAFYRELQLLIASGVDTATVLDVLAASRREDRSVPIIQRLRRSLAQGRTLSGAMALEPVFTRYETQCLQVGEETGRVADVLAELVGHYQAKVKLRRTLTSAFAYPAFVLIVTGAVVAFMLRVVVPMFAEVFGRSGAELPAITRTVVKLSHLAGPALIIGVLGLGLLIGALAMLKERPRIQSALSWTIIRLPLVGSIYRRAQFARFYRAMGSMLAAQLPLDRALALAMELVDHFQFRRAIADVRERVMKGGALHEACAAHALFDPKDIAMIAVAEEVRQLDRMFLRMAEENTAVVQHRTAMMGSILEPAMIVCIAVFVGTILVAMYLPMFKLSTAF